MGYKGGGYSIVVFVSFGSQMCLFSCAWAAHWQVLGAPCLHADVSWCTFWCYRHVKLMLQAIKLMWQKLIRSFGSEWFQRFGG